MRADDFDAAAEAVDELLSDKDRLHDLLNLEPDQDLDDADIDFGEPTIVEESTAMCWAWTNCARA